MGDQEQAREKIGEVQAGQIPTIDISTLRLERGDIILIRHTEGVDEQIAAAVRIQLRRTIEAARIQFKVPILVLGPDQELALLRVQRKLGAAAPGGSPAGGASEARFAESPPAPAGGSSSEPGE